MCCGVNFVKYLAGFVPYVVFCCVSGHLFWEREKEQEVSIHYSFNLKACFKTYCMDSGSGMLVAIICLLRPREWTGLLPCSDFCVVPLLEVVVVVQSSSWSLNYIFSRGSSILWICLKSLCRFVIQGLIYCLWSTFHILYVVYSAYFRESVLIADTVLVRKMDHW